VSALRRWSAATLAVLAALAGAGCATIERGRFETVSIRTHPPGALLHIDGGEPLPSPALVELRRGRDHLILAQLGDAQRVQPIRAEREWIWHLRNLFALPLVANLVDLVSGADRRLVPTDVEIDLRD
jgi:hypothetical protein